MFKYYEIKKNDLFVVYFLIMLYERFFVITFQTVGYLKKCVLRQPLTSPTGVIYRPTLIIFLWFCYNFFYEAQLCLDVIAPHYLLGQMFLYNYEFFESRNSKITLFTAGFGTGSMDRHGCVRMLLEQGSAVRG